MCPNHRVSESCNFLSRLHWDLRPNARLTWQAEVAPSDWSLLQWALGQGFRDGWGSGCVPSTGPNRAIDIGTAGGKPKNTISRRAGKDDPPGNWTSSGFPTTRQPSAAASRHLPCLSEISEKRGTSPLDPHGADHPRLMHVLLPSAQFVRA